MDSWAKRDVTLPKATMTKIIKEMLPPDARLAKDAKDMVVECCLEFINLISSESNDICSKVGKKTIAPEHILEALETLGFGEYVADVHAAYEKHCSSPRPGWTLRGKDPITCGMTEEEASALQQSMFLEARARMNPENIASEYSGLNVDLNAATDQE